jgi:hypothetical protein
VNRSGHDEEGPQHVAAALDVAREEAAPVGELRSKPLLDAVHGRW